MVLLLCFVLSHGFHVSLKQTLGALDEFYPDGNGVGKFLGGRNVLGRTH